MDGLEKDSRIYSRGYGKEKVSEERSDNTNTQKERHKM